MRLIKLPSTLIFTIIAVHGTSSGATLREVSLHNSLVIAIKKINSLPDFAQVQDIACILGIQLSESKRQPVFLDPAHQYAGERVFFTASQPKRKLCVPQSRLSVFYPKVDAGIFIPASKSYIRAWLSVPIDATQTCVEKNELFKIFNNVMRKSPATDVGPLTFFHDRESKSNLLSIGASFDASDCLVNIGFSQNMDKE